MEVKLIPIGVACAVALLLAQANVSIIFTGGVGKNGSTVAVRLLQCQPVVVLTECLKEVDMDHLSIFSYISTFIDKLHALLHFNATAFSLI